jgi:glutathione synthase
MRALIVADPVEKLKPKSDSSLMIAESLRKQKVDVSFTTAADLIGDATKVLFRTRHILSLKSKELPELSDFSIDNLLSFKLVFIRKDPPLDQSYVKLCWFLSPFEKKIRISNKASLILNHHEKLLPIQAVQSKFLRPQDIIPTGFVSNLKEALSYVRKLESEKIVLKPFFGFAGSDVFLLGRDSFESEAKPHFETSPFWIIQPFEKAVTTSGDSRIFFVNGKFVGGFSRMPKEGGHISNMAQGGSAVLRKFTKSELALISRVERWVRHLKLDFVGGDMIHSKLNEMNITSPTGFRYFETLTQKNLADVLVKGLLKSCRP